MLQKLLSAIIAEEWAREYDKRSSTSTPLIEASGLAKELSARASTWLQSSPPTAYHEMAVSLSRLHQDCAALLHCFATDCKLPVSNIPQLGTEIDITGTRPGCFTIETAQAAVGPMFTRLKDSLGRAKKREVAAIVDKRALVVTNIERYNEVKAQNDVRVSAAVAAAYVAFQSTPDKFSPIVKGIMNGIKVLVMFPLIGVIVSLTILRTKRMLIFNLVPLPQWRHLSISVVNINSPNRRKR